MRYTTVGVTPVQITCKVHGEITQRAGDHLVGKGCKACAKRAKVEDHEYIARMNSAHENRYMYDRFHYIDRHTMVAVTCPKHGDFQILPYNHLAGNGCYKCKSSRGEKRIRQWLDQHGLVYEQQKRFDSCRGTRYPLPFDFFIPSHKLLIEFDGEGHFVPIVRKKMTHEQADAVFERTQRYDGLKNKWVTANRFKLIRIKYDQNIDDVLTASLLRAVVGEIK